MTLQSNIQLNIGFERGRGVEGKPEFYEPTPFAKRGAEIYVAVSRIFEAFDAYISSFRIEWNEDGNEYTFACRVILNDIPEDLLFDNKRDAEKNIIAKLSKDLEQEAIAFIYNGRGALAGDKHDAWGDFNPDYFLAPEKKGHSF